MLFLLLLQGPGIEPSKSTLKADTLTTDLLGTIYNSVEIYRSDKAFEESLNSCLWTKLPNFFIQWNIRSKPAYSTLYSKFVDYDATTMTFGESLHFCWLRKYTAFLLVLPPLLFFSTIGEAQHIGMPTLMLLERAYCFVATAAIFSIYFNYRGEVSPLALT